MSLLTQHPPVARAIARIMQRATSVTASHSARKARARLPEYARRCETIDIPTPFGPTTAMVYRPAPAGDTPAVHINLHGGGYVLGSMSADDPICRVLAAESGSVVINVDYLVAPQHPFPVPPNHVYEVARWIAANGAEHGWDGTRLTIGGQSAGGGLSAAVARLALERDGPTICLQVLHYPPLDLSVPTRMKHAVIRRPMLHPWMGDVFDTSYVPDPDARSDRLVSPAGVADTADLTGIAPAVVITAEYDILRDEARRYADRLEHVGALVEYREIAGADHAYDLEDDDRARDTYTVVARHIRRSVS